MLEYESQKIRSAETLRRKFFGPVQNPAYRSVSPDTTSRNAGRDSISTLSESRIATG